MYRRYLAVLSMCLLVFMTGCEPETRDEPIPEVVVVPARQGLFRIYGNYVGTTQASKDVEIRARVSGFVEEITFREGSFVNEGDLLYLIDDRPYQARVSRLQANLKSAEAQRAKTQRDVERTEPLYKENAASQLDLDTAISERDQADALLAATQAELNEAKLELEYTRVTAPMSGIAGASEVDVGALVGTGGQSLLTTVKLVDPMFIEFHMSALDYLNAQRRKNSYEERKEAAKEGRAVEGWVRITLPDDTTYPYWGDISFTDPQVSPHTGTFAVRAVVANPDNVLLPGQYTRAQLELDALHDAVIINEKTIRVEQGGSYVMVVMPDDRVERRFIVPGPHHGEDVVVDSGLDPGERVIVEGMHRVQHGQQVTSLSEDEYKQRQVREHASPVDKGTG